MASENPKELKIAKAIPPNTYGIISPKYDMERVECLVGMGRPNPFYIAVLDRKVGIGLFGHIDRFTVSDHASTVFALDIMQRLMDLQAEDSILYAANVDSREVRKYSMKGKEREIGVGDDRRAFVQRLASGLIDEGLMASSRRVRILGLGNNCSLDMDKGLRVLPSLLVLREEGYANLQQPPVLEDPGNPLYHDFGVPIDPYYLATNLRRPEEEYLR